MIRIYKLPPYRAHVVKLPRFQLFDVVCNIFLSKGLLTVYLIYPLLPDLYDSTLNVRHKLIT
jgi:hypothetical protein